MSTSPSAASVLVSTEALEAAFQALPAGRVVLAADNAMDPAIDRLRAAAISDPLPPHFVGMPPPRALMALVVMNAVNSCYWRPDGRPPWQWRGLTGFRGMLALVVEGARHAENLPAWVAEDLHGQGHDLLLLPERLAALEEVAQAFPSDAAAWDLLQESHLDAATFVTRLVALCPRFDDRLADAGALVMHKRAWLITMLGERLAASHPALAFRDPGRMALAIDYRLPVACRWLGLLTLAPDLAARIAQGGTFDPRVQDQARDEQALRLATAICFRRLLAHAPDLTPARLDVLLWAGSCQAADIPAHRCLTLAY